ncbi:MAG: phospholipid carrier-dependent glycosyltransferase, partial [Chloroflexota bacterium]
MAVVVIALAFRVFSAVTVPPWQGPDEPKHYEYARILVDKGTQFWAERRLPNPADADPALQRAIIASLTRNQYWERVGWLPSGSTTPAVLPTRFDQIWPDGTHTQLHRPSLYYFLGAGVLALLPGAGLEEQLLALRLLSAVLSTLAVPIAYLAARRLTPGNRLVPALTAAFVAFLPMHVFIGGTVNNDNLLTLAGALCALGLATGLRRGFGLGEWALTLLGLALALATKRAAIGLLPAVALAGVFWLSTLSRRRLALAVAVAALAALGALTVGLGEARAGVEGGLAAYALNGRHQLESLLLVPFASQEVLMLLARLTAALFASFWGIFGWFNVLLGLPFYVVFAVASGAAALGFLLWLGRGAHGDQPAWRIGLVCAVAAASLVVLALAERLAYLDPHELPQGRYLFVALVPLAIIHALGWRQFLPERWRDSIRVAVFAGGLLV